MIRRTRPFGEASGALASRWARTLSVALLCMATISNSARAQNPPSAPVCSTSCDVVTGVVYDSLSAEPLGGAFIVASPGGATTTSDSLGRFALTSDGRVQQLTVYHESLDGMGLGAIGAIRPPNAERWQNATVSTPSLLTIWPRLCDSRRPDRQRTGIITGTARLADNTTRVSGAKVIVQWQSVFDDKQRSEEAITDSLGDYVICGVEELAEPMLAALSSQAQSGAIMLPSQLSPLRRVDLVLASLEAPRAMLRGKVVNGQGAPLANVRIDVDGVADEVTTRDDGTFAVANVPLGSRMLSLRAVGYSPVSQVVDVLTEQRASLVIPLSRTIELEGVKITERVTVRRERSEFDVRRRAGSGRFVDSLQIMKSPFVRAALQMTPGVQVISLGNRATTEFDIRGRDGCQAHIYLDGTASDIDEVNRIPPANIAAVEMYPSVAFAPARFIMVRADVCAVAIFWTKTGLRP